MFQLVTNQQRINEYSLVINGSSYGKVKKSFDVNETNELGLLIINRIENLNYGNKNFLFIEFDIKTL